MAPSKYRLFKDMQLGGLVLLTVGVILRSGFGEHWGTGVALVGIALLWLGRLLAWWKTG
jgi:hypothetical protein